MTSDYTDLVSLRSHPGYQKLQLLWAEQGRKIMDGLNKASKLSGKDLSLRYHAGEWNGFDLGVGMLDRAIDEIKRQLGNEVESKSVEEMLSRLPPRNETRTSE